MKTRYYACVDGERIVTLGGFYVGNITYHCVQITKVDAAMKESDGQTDNIT